MITLEKMKKDYGRCHICNVWCIDKYNIIHSEGYIEVKKYAYNQYNDTQSKVFFCNDCWWHIAGPDYELEEEPDYL